MNSKTMAIVALASVLCILFVPILSEESDADTWERTTSAYVDQEFTYTASISSSYANDESRDNYKINIEKPDWISVEKRKSGSNVYYDISGTPPEEGQYIVKIHEEAQGGWLAGIVTSDTIITINVTIPDGSFYVTFDANGGTFSNGASTYSSYKVLSSGEVTLPDVQIPPDGKKLVGWSTSPTASTSTVGVAGATVSASPDTTYYAIWRDMKLMPQTTEIVTTSEYQFTRTPTLYDEDGNLVEGVSYTLSNLKMPSNMNFAKISGNAVSIDLFGVFSGNYSITVEVDAPGYETGVWTIEVDVTVMFIDDPVGRYPTGFMYTDSLVLQPSSAYISNGVVRLNGSIAAAGTYNLEYQGQSYSFTAEEEGTWTVTLTFSATGFLSQTHSFRFTYYEDSSGDDDVDPPTISGIAFDKMEDYSLPNTYFFYTVGVSGTDVIISWDFGDGEYATNDNQIHSFDRANNYRVTCTVSNSGGSAQAYVDIAAGDTTSDESFSDFTNINSPYLYDFEIDTQVPRVTVTCDGKTQEQLEWLDYDVVKVGEKYIITFSGTCTDVSFVGKSIHVEVVGAEDSWSWNIAVYAENGSHESEELKVSASFTNNGRDVVVKLNPADDTIPAFIQWGDGTTSFKMPSSSEFTHTYPNLETYTATITWQINTANGQSAPTYNLVIDLGNGGGGQTGEPIVVYIGGNGATGNMDVQSGSTTYTIQECGFKMEGKYFLAWNTDPEFRGTTFVPGDEVTPTGTLYLYAMWATEEKSPDWVMIGAILFLVIIAAVVVRWVI